MFAHNLLDSSFEIVLEILVVLGPMSTTANHADVIPDELLLRPSKLFGGGLVDHLNDAFLVDHKQRVKLGLGFACGALRYEISRITKRRGTLVEQSIDRRIGIEMATPIDWAGPKLGCYDVRQHPQTPLHVRWQIIGRCRYLCLVVDITGCAMLIFILCRTTAPRQGLQCALGEECLGSLLHDVSQVARTLPLLGRLSPFLLPLLGPRRYWFHEGQIAVVILLDNGRRVRWKQLVQYEIFHQSCGGGID